MEVGSTNCPSPVLVSASANAGTITVDANATLDFADQTLTLTTTGIVVNGLMRACEIGQNNPANQVTINFSSPTQARQTGHSLGITVNQGGALVLEGRKGVVPFNNTSWTYLSCPAGPTTFGPGTGVASPVLGASSASCPGGLTTLQVEAGVAKDWQPGDWIVVGTTDFAEQNSEFVQILSLGTTPGVRGTTITLMSNTPLTQYHFGGPAPDTGSAAFNDDYTKNYGIDERAEVGLITRNVKLTTTLSSSTSSPSHWGGEIDFEPGSMARLWGVEIEKFGKPLQGSYPVDFIGDVAVHPPVAPLPPNIMDSDSIHHSYNHGIALTSGQGQGASGLVIANNVVARAVDHLFYLADGNEINNQFTNNLGLGAMTNSYAIPPTGDQLASGYTATSAAAQYWWVGDYLTNNPANPACATTNASSPCYDGYDGFNIANTDAINSNAWASGFYISNVQNTFTSNSIGGCQGQGRGFWYLPVNNGTCNVQTVAEANTPLLSGLAQDAGSFANNRAHACYTGLDTAPDVGTDGNTLSACPLEPQYNSADIYTQIKGMTVTRNRNRGIWVRPKFTVIDGARAATNRDSIAVVSSGGTEGSPPGEWSVVSNSIFAGISANNPGRFGPCPYSGQGAVGRGLQYGCLDEDQITAAGGHGYLTPIWNMEGEMLYDGPARLSKNEFINFMVNSTNYLTAADQAFLAYFTANQAGFIYEGDAAFGWFQSNVNSYPPTQYSENATFTNTDLRHQVYTADVNLSTFQDGDKNTVLLDETGATLAGYEVVPARCTAPCTPVAGKSPISLNNLPFVSTPNAVDECIAEGAQDVVAENRPTALMSPQDYATLEFSMLTPSTTNNNVVTFAKDQVDFGGNAGQQSDNAGGTVVTCPSTHSCMALVGRNQQGVYEPKVINGLGYTVMAQNGVQQYTDVTFTDASVAGGISQNNPFQIRLSICYKSANGQPANANLFQVTTGLKSLGQATSSSSAALMILAPYWNMNMALPPPGCNGLDNVNPNYLQDCFTSPPNNQLAALDPSNTNPLATDLANLSSTNYYYNPTTGFLTFLMQQTSPNGAVASTSIPQGGGPSPLGSCNATSGDPCPDVQNDETFYSCPEGGCGLYTVAVTDTTYKPGPSTCTPYGTAGQDYTAPWPASLNQLAYSNGMPISTTQVATNMVKGTNFPHITDNNPTNACPASPASATPVWISSSNPQPVAPVDFALGLPANVCPVTLPVSLIPGPNLLPLTPGQSYTLSFCDGAQQCSQSITVPPGATAANPAYTAGSGNCGIGSGSGTIGVAAAFSSTTMCTCPS